jgi:hypothetical protein
MRRLPLLQDKVVLAADVEEGRLYSGYIYQSPEQLDLKQSSIRLYFIINYWFCQYTLRFLIPL